MTGHRRRDAVTAGRVESSATLLNSCDGDLCRSDAGVAGSPPGHVSTKGRRRLAVHRGWPSSSRDCLETGLRLNDIPAGPNPFYSSCLRRVNTVLM